ncbi:TATA-binding protein-associated factor 2N [Saguinus oedipus]|uniref:TATA-binding protein-associated factor 2N n=1 Tax=Saguinus oedipus TaxID=9490 RepID=A0ABQ9VTA4_SAGOE|nr:TATA-binding protein-associated factor 2N [Saguinus oedipus]
MGKRLIPLMDRTTAVTPVMDKVSQSYGGYENQKQSSYGQQSYNNQGQQQNMESSGSQGGRAPSYDQSDYGQQDSYDQQSGYDQHQGSYDEQSNYDQQHDSYNQNQQSYHSQRENYSHHTQDDRRDVMVVTAVASKILVVTGIMDPDQMLKYLNFYG